MSFSEKEQLGKWKSGLTQSLVVENSEKSSANPDDQDAFWGSTATVSDEYKQSAAAQERKEVISYLTQLEEVMTEEPVFIRELKTNIDQNFVIIEDTFREEFMALGIDYKDYKSTHPDGKFNRERWVSERSQELQALKRKEFEKIKSEMLASH